MEGTAYGCFFVSQQAVYFFEDGHYQIVHLRDYPLCSFSEMPNVVTSLMYTQYQATQRMP